MAVSITCRYCRGTGQRHSQALSDTLKVVKSKEWTSTHDIYDALPDRAYVNVTALNNRLVSLFSLKLVACEKRGKAKFWKKL